MNNRAIDEFFEKNGLWDSVQKHVRPPNEMWGLQVGRFPVLIQTQENADRMRIVAFLGDADELDSQELLRLLQANYHTALDARYAITDDGHLVSVFLHPFEELTLGQFILGFCQAIGCAETCGSAYSSGNMVFGHTSGSNGSEAEHGTEDYRSALIAKIRGA